MSHKKFKVLDFQNYLDIISFKSNLTKGGLFCEKDRFICSSGGGVSNG